MAYECLATCHGKVEYGYMSKISVEMFIMGLLLYSALSSEGSSQHSLPDPSQHRFNAVHFLAT